MSDENKSYSKSDVDIIVNDYESKLNQKEETIKQLTEKIATLDMEIKKIIGEEEEDDPTNSPLSDEEIAEMIQKVKIETTLQLFDLANAEYKYDVHGNKTKAAQLISCISSIPLQTIRNYLSDRWKKKAIPKPYRNQLENCKQIFEETGLTWKEIKERGY